MPRMAILTGGEVSIGNDLPTLNVCFGDFGSSRCGTCPLRLFWIVNVVARSDVYLVNVKGGATVIQSFTEVKRLLSLVVKFLSTLGG